MPQMAPSLWLIIYVLVWLSTYLMASVVFCTSSCSSLTQGSISKSNSMEMLWQ
uniref:ATP synthase F0 subunit 8 n=1 Tax=Metacrangonyx goulmimensis TaxID=1199162 RepID=K7ZW25_9CRUS|nr:ATP synthase F0 subunit 8 [Metacrangonyx goulmimensis]CCI69523.1 ATP synthase F0 subunit 8 [Metacrangonyx goulmimensis]